MGKRIFFFLFIFSAFSSAYAQTAPHTRPIADLQRDFLNARSTGDTLKIVLDDNVLVVGKAVVTAGKALRLRALNGYGIQFPINASYSRPSGFKDPEVAKKMDENKNGAIMGILLELENNTWIREVRFELLSNSFDTMTVRAEVYQKDGERYIPLMSSPRYCQIEKSRNPVEYRIDLSDLYIQAKGSVYVAIEPIKISSAGTVTAKIYRNTKYHWINTATGTVYNAYRNLGIGLRVYGSELNSR